MKCQRKASPYWACLRGEILGAVLADDLDPGLGERGQVLGGHVLGRSDDRHLRPELAADALVVARGPSSGDKANDSLPPRDALVAAVREEALGRARRAEVDAVDARAAGRAQGSLGDAPEVELPVAHEAEPEARGGTAPRPPRPPRSSTGRSPARRPRRRGRRRAPARPKSAIPPSRPRQPACRTASAGVPPFARASAIGRQSAASASSGSPRSSVQSPSPRSPREPACGAQDVGRVVLVVHAQRVGVGADLGAETPAVLVHPLGLVAGRAAEVERRERALADAAFARREDDLVRAGCVLPADHWAISSRAAASSESRPSSSPFSFRRRSSESTSPTRGDSASPERSEIGAVDLQMHVRGAARNIRAAQASPRARARTAARRADAARRARPPRPDPAARAARRRASAPPSRPPRSPAHPVAAASGRRATHRGSGTSRARAARPRRHDGNPEAVAVAQGRAGAEEIPRGRIGREAGVNRPVGAEGLEQDESPRRPAARPGAARARRAAAPTTAVRRGRPRSPRAQAQRCARPARSRSDSRTEAPGRSASGRRRTTGRGARGSSSPRGRAGPRTGRPGCPVSGPASATAIALIVKSRRKRSSSIVEGSTVGSAAGAA